ncbi:MAG: acyltransferase [Lachnospiraceae bacterium]|nr:acyltransferase [Lachnospiraceae bacterium]
MVKETKRVNYIDNLRWITVSLLVLYHTAMAYNTWGEANYIFFEEIKPIAAIVVMLSPWFMPLMFLLAGVSSAYSLKKRGYKAFIVERFKRLGIPFVFGLLVINPVLSFIADVTHNGYTGGYFKHYGVYFTRVTDLTGYDGGFTLGHFWFIAVLMGISLLSCLIIKLTDIIKKKYIKNTKTFKIIGGVLLAVTAVGTFEIYAYGKRLITYLAVYLLGYYFFKDREFVKKIAAHKWLLTAVFVAASVANAVIFVFIGGNETLNTICMYGSFIFGLPALIAIGHDHLDYTGHFSAFNSRISYVYYIIHYPIVVLSQYYFDMMNPGYVIIFFLTIAVSYPFTDLLCYCIDKTKYIRVLFGLKRKN